MSEINLSKTKVKRPPYLIAQDLINSKIKPTEDELKNIPVIKHWIEKVGLTASNIPDINVLKEQFKNTTMVQLMDVFTNRTVCVNEFGEQVNSNPIGEDFECRTCDQYIQPNEEFEHGQCEYAYLRFKERFGDKRPEGLDKLIEKQNSEEHVPLDQEEVLKLTEGITEEDL
jgi:hypothetical protein